MNAPTTGTRRDEPRKIVTTPFRMSFPFLLEPRTDPQSGRTTYQLTMLFPPGLNTEVYRNALKAAMIEKFGPDQSKWPNVRHTPREVIRDFGAFNAAAKNPLPGDWNGWTMIRANCSDKYAPNVVGPTRGQDGFFPRVNDRREVYGGRWASAVIEAYVFQSPRNNGVTFGLKNVQLLKHDTPFGISQSRPEDDFEDASEEWAGDAFERSGPAQPAPANNVTPLRPQQAVQPSQPSPW